MTQLIAARVSEVVAPAVAQALHKAHGLEAQGAKLTYLLRGEPDFDTPDHVCQAAMESLRAGDTHYTSTQGVRGLREAVSKRVECDFGMTPDPDEEIMVTTGATMGIYTAIQAVIGPGDEVIIFDPMYDPYPTVVRLAGGVPIRVRAEESHGHFSVRKDAIEAKVTQRTKAILVNNPWNPTGTVMTADELNYLVDLAEAYDLVLIVDEIYEKITFGGHKHINLASLSAKAYARTITINSFSKTYAMTGWRIGYTVASPSLTRAMRSIAQQFSRSAATFVQHAAIAALTGPQEHTRRMVKAYRRRRDLITDSLRQAGFSTFCPPEGTFFILLDVRMFDKGSEKMSDYLMEKAKVVTIPGNVYGLGGEGFIRLSFAYDEKTIREGIEAVAACLSGL
jgi:aspartate/methionine/tyrosine aminotransferase|tara:strand:- start:1744 stop:2925 length:1182 start_codon:yes stop_codon:yes gene_type:complete